MQLYPAKPQLPAVLKPGAEIRTVPVHRPEGERLEAVGACGFRLMCRRFVYLIDVFCRGRDREQEKSGYPGFSFAPLKVGECPALRDGEVIEIPEVLRRPRRYCIGIGVSMGVDYLSFHQTT